MTPPLSNAGPSYGAKYDAAGSAALVSSQGRGWRGLAAEVRRHRFIDAPPFVQPVTEVVIVASGRASVDRRGDSRTQQFDALPGSFCVCPAGVPVEHLRVRSEGVELIHLYFSSTEAALTSWHYSGGLVDPLVSQIGAAIAEELQEESAGGDLLLDTLRHALVARISNRFQRSGNENRAAKATGLNPKRLARVIEFLKGNVESNLSLSDIATEACLSRHHFVRAFKAATGTTPYHYLSALRSERARQLLSGGDETVESIASRLQFSDSANFSRAFRRQVGVSPSTYRELAAQALKPHP